MQELSIINQSKTLLVTDHESLTNATAFLSTLNKSLDTLTAEKEKVTKPLNEALKAERARFKPMEKELEDAITHVKTSITTYVNKQIADAKVLQEKILSDGRTSIETKIEKLANVDITSTDKVQTEQGSVSFITVKKWRITNANDIPRTFLIPNEDAIKQAMKENSPILGIEYYEEQQLRNYR